MPNRTGYEPNSGEISQDYSGSYDEWRTRTVNDLVRRYVQGLGGIGSDDPELGLPSAEDMGSGADGKTGQYSFATVQYWERFVDKYGATDPFVAQNYGPPPERRATYSPDPNSAGEINRTQLEADANQNALDRDWNDRNREDNQDFDAGQRQADRDWESGQRQADRDFEAGQNALDRDLERYGIDTQATTARQIAELQAQVDRERMQVDRESIAASERTAAAERVAAMERLQAQLADNAAERDSRAQQNALDRQLSVEQNGLERQNRLDLLARELDARRQEMEADRTWRTGQNAADRELTISQNELDRQNRRDLLEAELEARRQESAADRDWRTGQNEADRNLTISENANQRSHELSLLLQEIDARRQDNEADRAWRTGENALDRQLTISQNEADRALRTRELDDTMTRFNASMAQERELALLDDLTRRYIAEGDWGVQRYVVEQNNAGALERLNLELGFQREDLAQRAIAERNRHHEGMVGLALEVAKYDAELAAQPRNWLKYAGWLKNRDIVVSGLSLSMAAEAVPEEGMDPNEGAAADPVSSIAAASGQEPAASGPQPGGINLDGDPSQIARDLLAKNPMSGVDGVDNSPENLAAIAASLDTSGNQDPSGGGLPAASGQQPAAGAQQPAGPMVADANVAANAVAPAQPSAATGAPDPLTNGARNDYRKWRNLLPSQQEMKAGQVEYQGKYFGDWQEELERNRPKGGYAGSVSYG